MTGRRYPSPRPSDLRALADCEGPVISLFVPVTAAIPDAAENRVRHARAVSAGMERWRAVGADESQLEQAESALAGFAEEAASPAARVASRAAYWAPELGLQVFGLPMETDEAVRVASTAHLRPLVRAARSPGRYRVLMLSAKRVALFEGDQDALEEVSAAALPASLEDALGSELTEPSLQFHTGRGGGARPVYHGQGGAPRGRRVDLERFHQRVAQALENEIGADVVPLVLAADAQHHPGLERALGRDVGLIPTALEGNADHLSASALHAATWPLAVASAGDASESLEQARAGPAPLVTKISELVTQAVMGRIRRLWVPEVGSIPGSVDPTQGCAAEAWGDDDLIEDLLVWVLRKGGEVEVVGGAEFSADAECLAALLR